MGTEGMQDFGLLCRNRYRLATCLLDRMRIEINRLVHPEERAITNCKLEDEATQLSGQGVPITGFDDPQLS